MRLDEIIIKKFIPEYKKLRNEYLNKYWVGWKNTKIRMKSNNDDYYSELSLKEAGLIGDSCKYIESEIIAGKEITEDEWNFTIVVLKNSGEMLRGRSTYSANLRLLLIATISFLYFYNIYFSLASVFPWFSAFMHSSFEFFGFFLIITLVLENFKNNELTNIYFETANICELIKSRENKGD